MSEEEESRFQP